MMIFLRCLKERGFVAVAALLLSATSMADTTNYNVVGSAYSLKTGDLLYRETHKRVTNTLHEVEYSEPDGTVFSHKTVDLSESLITPSFQQINERNGEEISVKQEGRRVLVKYKESTSSRSESDRLNVASGMVIDAGFDGFIRQYWSVLESGKKLDVEYLVPSKLTTFGFRFSRAECISGTKQNALCFSLSPTSWVVKLAVDPIVVAYDRADKTLLRFTGRANISNVEGKYESVDIQYQPL
jgi:hypothetical protein